MALNLNSVGDIIPISIGTANAIQSVLEVTDGINHQLSTSPLIACGALYISLWTLARNAINSVTKENKELVNVDTIEGIVLGDMQTIIAAFEQIKPVFFYNLTRKSIRKNYGGATRILANSAKAIEQEDIIEQVIERVKVDETILEDRSMILEGDMSVDVKTTLPIMLLTSHPIDLIEFGQKNSVYCLQSQTGRIVSKTEFHRFYKVKAKYKETGYPRIPFNRLFLQLIGDGKMFLGVGIKQIDEIVNVAEEKEWTQRTTHDRVKMTMQSAGIWQPAYDEVNF